MNVQWTRVVYASTTIPAAVFTTELELDVKVGETVEFNIIRSYSRPILLSGRPGREPWSGKQTSEGMLWFVAGQKTATTPQAFFENPTSLTTVEEEDLKHLSFLGNRVATEDKVYLRA